MPCDTLPVVANSFSQNSWYYILWFSQDVTITIPHCAFLIYQDVMWHPTRRFVVFVTQDVMWKARDLTVYFDEINDIHARTLSDPERFVARRLLSDNHRIVMGTHSTVLEGPYLTAKWVSVENSLVANTRETVLNECFAWIGVFRGVWLSTVSVSTA